MQEDNKLNDNSIKIDDEKNASKSDLDELEREIAKGVKLHAAGNCAAEHSDTTNIFDKK